jgi:hypothetical protein
MWHANLAGDWMREYSDSGIGSATGPIRSRNVIAKCSIYGAAALERAGYFYSRF